VLFVYVATRYLSLYSYLFLREAIHYRDSSSSYRARTREPTRDDYRGPSGRSLLIRSRTREYGAELVLSGLNGRRTTTLDGRRTTPGRVKEAVDNNIYSLPYRYPVTLVTAYTCTWYRWKKKRVSSLNNPPKDRTEGDRRSTLGRRMV